jgi:outer membrane immunogenic protein
VALAAMLAGPAMAADMPVKARPAPPPVLYDWSGIYAGFSIGGMWYDVDRHFPNYYQPYSFYPASIDHSSSGSDAVYDFHVGIQAQWGAWVLGLEAAIIGCFQECRSESALLPASWFGSNITSEHKITNLFTFGPRIGFAWDRWMIFATGGGAAATLKGTYCYTVTGLCDANLNIYPGNGQSTNWGYFIGGGFEYMVHKGPLVDVILGVEYQHWDVGSKQAYCDYPGCAYTSFNDYDLGATGDTVRARLTIKTGWGILGPIGKAPVAVAAKY